MRLPDPAAEVKARHIREHDVQNGQGQLLPLHTGQSLSAQSAGEDGVSFVFQVQPHQLPDFLLVVNH